MTRGDLLKKIATESLGEEYARKIWKRVEFIGDIAIIRTPLGLDPIELKPLADELLKRIKYIKSVWAAIPGISGEFRLRKHVWLAGEMRSETIYREHDCLFKIDFTKVYISPSLNYEHIRVARLVNPGEIIVNMFAGAGLFSIIIAKYSKPLRVYSIDINPYAYSYMIENIKLNKVEDIVIPILGDSKTIIESSIRDMADRVLMPYPELAIEYLPHAIMALRNRHGWIHIYLHVFTEKQEHWRSKTIDILENRLLELHVENYEIKLVRKIRNVGPREHQVVVDLYVC